MPAHGVYTRERLPSITWPEPIETIYQSRRGRTAARSAVRRPDITRSDRLFIAAAVEIPRAKRYGLVTWLADRYDVSRQTVYDIAHQVQREEQLAWAAQSEDGAGAARAPDRDFSHERAVLTLLVSGGMSLRATQDCLEEIVGSASSVGRLNELINEAGARAGQVLDCADWSAVRPFVAARDEKFFDDRAYMLTVHPESLAIVSGHVEDEVDSERWGVSLALDQERTGHAIIGLAEDAASWYPASLREGAALTNTPFLVPVQKDIFHVLRRAGQTLEQIEKAAISKLRKAEQKATRVTPSFMLIRDFEGWEEAHCRADEAVESAQEVHFWVGCLADALEVVEAGNGAIRDVETASWYLEEILQALSQSDEPRARSLAKYTRSQQAQLLTFLEWLEPLLDAWRRQAREHFEDPELVRYFERTVAKAWRISRIDSRADSATRRLVAHLVQDVDGLCQNDTTARRLACTLRAILDQVVRGSSAVETINSLLERYLPAHRSFQRRETAQNYLNLFMLWHGMRRFRRGKRQGKSPFEIAGVRIFDLKGRETDDWLAALGYPAAA